MKKIKFELIVTFTVVAAVIGGCGTGAADKKPAAQIQELPALHEIPVPEGYPTTQDDLGADAFAHEGDHADSRYYIFNDYYNMESGGTLHIIPEFRTYQQTTEYSCGPCAALMVLEHFGIKDKDELQLAEELHTDTAKGTDPADMARYFEGLGWNTESHADYTDAFDSPEEFEAWALEKIDAGIPIMVDWVDWSGHWQVLIGIDTEGKDNAYDDVLIFADSYDVTDHYQDGYYTYPLGRWFYMWREGPCAAKETVMQQPYVAAAPKR